MREPLSTAEVRARANGITPAHAGTTHDELQAHVAQRDHPRSCGNHYDESTPHLHFTGSPPLMREPHQDRSLMDYSLGITPAHAGTTKQPRRIYG